MDWIIQNWHLLASVVLALVNLTITLVVHGRSSFKIGELSSDTAKNLNTIYELNLELINILRGDLKK